MNNRPKTPKYGGTYDSRGFERATALLRRLNLAIGDNFPWPDMSDSGTAGEVITLSWVWHTAKPKPFKDAPNVRLEVGVFGDPEMPLYSHSGSNQTVEIGAIIDDIKDCMKAAKEKGWTYERCEARHRGWHREGIIYKASKLNETDRAAYIKKVQENK